MQNLEGRRNTARDVHRDRQWIERIQLGDDRAFAELFYAYYPILCDFALSVAKSAADAEEVVDDVLFSIWEQRAANVPLDYVAPYLFAAVRNRGFMAIRSHERRFRREQVYANESTVTMSIPSNESWPDESDDIRMIYSIVSELPERCQRIFLLRWTAHLSYSEIAKVMDVTEKTVENQLGIAMKRIREHITLTQRHRGQG